MKRALIILLLCCLTAMGQLAGFSFSPSPVTTTLHAGVAFNGITITATNPSGGTFTSFTSTVTWGGTANITNNSGGNVSAAFTAGVLTSPSMLTFTAGTNLTWTCAATTNSAYTGSVVVNTILAGAQNGFKFSSISSPQISGQAFSIPSIAAVDSWGNTVLTYNGTVTVAVFTGNATIFPTTNGPFSSGVFLNASETLTATGAGIQTNIMLSFTGNSVTGYSPAFTIQPTLLTIIGAPTSPAATLTINATSSGSTLTVVGK